VRIISTCYSQTLKCNKLVNYQIHTANFQKPYKSYRPQTFEHKCSYLCLIDCLKIIMIIIITMLARLFSELLDFENIWLLKNKNKSSMVTFILPSTKKCTLL